MGDRAHLTTWIDVAAKQRFVAAAASALLKRLVEQMLAVGNEVPAAEEPPADPRDTRVTVRLVPEDRALLRERAAARSMAAATYVSFLVRSHLRQLAPLPEQELSAFRAAVNELGALGRNLNSMLRLLYQDPRQGTPGRVEVGAMLKVCEGLRNHFKAVIRENVVSWEVGHRESRH